MAINHPPLVKQQNVACKAETTNGTAVALTAADGKFNFYDDPAITPDVEVNERQSPGSMSKWVSIPGGFGANVELPIELANTGTATVPQWFSMLSACGFNISSGTATVASGSASAATYTAGRYVDGWQFSAAGCMFNLEIDAQSGRIVSLKYSGKGTWQTPSTTALITPTYETGVPLVFKGATLTIASVAYVVPSFNINLNSDVQMRRDGNSATALRSAVIVGRDPRMKMMVEADTTKDWYADHANRTEAAFSCVLGTGSNGVVTITAPKIQLRTPPVPTNQNGILMWDCDFGLNKSAAAGDDEIVVALT